MPALEALLERFSKAKTQPLGISVDSVYSHANWAKSLGGVSFPLLADFHPKGATAEKYGLYLADKGITDRATVIIDARGVVCHVSSVTPAGKRDVAELAALCEGVARQYEGELSPAEAPPGLEPDATLYVKNACSFSKSVLLARDNLHLESRLKVRNITDERAALEELRKASGKEQVPCLVVGGKPMLESGEITKHLVSRTTGLWS